MKRPILAVALAGLLLVGLAPGALATTTLFPIDDSVTVVNVDPGVVTVRDHVVSIRGQRNSQPVFDEVLGPGTDTNIIDSDLNLKTLTGAIRGKTVIDYPYAKGGWNCTFEGQFRPELFFLDGTTPVFGYRAHEVCHGYGALTGAQLRGDFGPTAANAVRIVGYWFVPGDRQP
jgi:hypothetical protein